MLDLGCGSGVWLAELSARLQAPDLAGVGVDIALPADVADGRGERIARRSKADAARYEAEPARHRDLHRAPSHAFGGLAPTLDAVRRHLRPGGRVPAR